MSDEHQRVGKAEPRDHWEETRAYLRGLEATPLKHDEGEVAELISEPRYAVFMSESRGDVFRVDVDSENKYMTIEATLGPWQAKQVIEFIRQLPSEPDGD